MRRNNSERISFIEKNLVKYLHWDETATSKVSYIETNIPHIYLTLLLVMLRGYEHSNFFKKFVNSTYIIHNFIVNLIF